MISSSMIDPSTYTDIELLPALINEIELFVEKTNLSNFLINVGEHGEGHSIDWNAVIPWDTTGNWNVGSDLQNAASSIISIAKTIPGLKRITINFLGSMSVMPMHQDSEVFTTDYNMVIPLTDNGWFLLDGKVLKSSKHRKIIFDGVVLHGVMNDSLEERRSIYLLIDKSRFH